MGTTTKAAQAWAELNERQQLWLRTIYDVDQDTEEWHKGAYLRGDQQVPPRVWRWLEYEHTATRRQRGVTRGKGLLQARLDELDVRDEGAGSTIKKLAGLELIKIRYEDDDPSCNRMALQLTRYGRAVARAGWCDDARPGRRNKQRPLSEGLWSMLADVYGADPEKGFRPRGYNLHPAWDKLAERGFITISPGLYDVIRLTDAGREHYRAEWQAYAQMYPTVDAPHPDGDPVWSPEVDEQLRVLREVCRALDSELWKIDQDLQCEVPAVPEIVKDRGPELLRATTLRSLRAQHAARGHELLVEHRAELLALSRTATARYLAVAAAVVTAVAEGSDPVSVLDAEPLALGTIGELPHPKTGLSGVDLDISKARPGGIRRRKRSTAPAPESAVTTKQARDYAEYLAGLAQGGTLARLLLRREPG